jgi:hypothetical protein
MRVGDTTNAGSEISRVQLVPISTRALVRSIDIDTSVVATMAIQRTLIAVCVIEPS